MRTGATLGIVLLASLFAVSVAAQQPTAPSMQQPETTGQRKMDESAMMAMHKEMMARMEEMEARLDDLVKNMNAATGSRKADAIAAVVNELVAQRKEMHRHMMTMQPAMMRHAMEHAGMGKAMMDCPMMKGMSEKPAEPKKPGTDGHAVHHRR